MDAAAWTLPPSFAPGPPVAVAAAHPGSSSISAPVVMWSTAGLPVVLPLAVLSPAGLADLAANSELLSRDQRVAALLAVDRRAEAFALARAELRPLGAAGRLELELAAWAAGEQARLGLPASRGPVLVIGDDARGTVAGEVRRALDDVRTLMGALPWPRWAGPLVIFVDGDERGIPAAGVVRPALPLLRMQREIDGKAVDLRASAAAMIARLALDLSVPPASGWPPWLRAGVSEVARARAAGEGPSPRLMRERRVAAGPQVIRSLVTATDDHPDHELCGALVQPLVAAERSERLISLLDLLRQGASSEGAVRIAFGLTPESW